MTAGVDEFLTSTRLRPSGLVIEGAAGIGKTTLWLSAMDRAREQRFRILSARAVAAESVMAYTTLADLLRDVDCRLWAGLPDPQRLAMDRILLPENLDGRASDQRALLAGVLFTIEAIADETPVIVALDDLQWLDASSRQVVAYTARRLKGRVGVLATVRSDTGAHDPVDWLQLPRPQDTQRITVSRMSIDGLQAVIAERLGRSLPWSTMLRINDVSGGNPFYALEIARAIDDGLTSTIEVLPRSLSQLVNTRIERLGADVIQALLAASCVALPTVEVVARAVGIGPAETVRLLERAEDDGILTIDGHRLQFTHPLLAKGVYSGVSAAQRRAMHQRLSGIVDEPELQARHMALAATTADPRTLQSLDVAADIACRRGALVEAAELIDLAIGLGGDTALRRIRAAGHHLNAGDTARARSVLEAAIERTPPGVLRAEASNLLAVARLYDDSVLEAAKLLGRALTDAGDDLELRVQILVTLSFALFTIDDDAAGQTIDDAVTQASRLGQPHLLGQALSRQVLQRFFNGEGIDEPGLRRACELEDHTADTPVAFRPSLHRAMLLGWTGRLDEAHAAIASVSRHCTERGDESHLAFVALQGVRIEIWRGHFAEAAVVTEEAMTRARQLGGDIPLFSALTSRCALACYAGRVDDARSDAREALAAARRCGTSRTAAWTTAALGFLELSLGRHRAALVTLQPLLERFDTALNVTEINVASFLPDAVEAFIALGRLADAERLIRRLERNGERLDRPWMLATGARGRAMLYAAQGDLTAAGDSAGRAMTEHDRLPMPFERARTQLLVGQIQRRGRQKSAAAKTLTEALTTFHSLGTPLWADRVRAELTRVNVGGGSVDALTPSERRVAELAASGLTNRDIGTELFISPKTVEANLARVYRKLDIRSRAELGRRLVARTGADG